MKANRVALMLGILLALFTLTGLAGDQPEQGIFVPQVRTVGFIQFSLILLSPSILAITATVVFIRYMRVFSYDPQTGMGMSRLQVFWTTVGVGAVFGVASQFGLQTAVNYLTGMPITWELLLLAFMFTGIASVLAYELLRVFFTWRYNKTKEHIWVVMYNWLSVTSYKKAVAKNQDSDSCDGDAGPLTQSREFDNKSK